jgi:polyisoprenoid-binding protein YceI
MKTFVIVSGLAMAAAWSGAACAQQVQAAGSEIAFTSKQMGVPVDGKFRQFTAQVAFDPKKPEAAQIAFTIDLASVSLGATEVEAEVVKPDWFDTKKFPQASFQSTAVKAPASTRWPAS